MHIHSIALFNIVNGQIGILLGQNNTIETSFEIVYKDGIDFEFYHERIGQFKTIMPHLQPVGLYFPSELEPEILPQQKELGLPISVIRNKNQFTCLMDGIVQDYSIESDEIETYAINSINHAKQDGDLVEFQSNLMVSVNQLMVKLTDIVQFLSNETDVNKKIEINRLVGQLTKKVGVLRRKAGESNDIKHLELLFNEMILLNYKLNCLDKLSNQVDFNISSIISKSTQYEWKF